MTVMTLSISQNEMRNEHNMSEAESERKLRGFIREYNIELGTAFHTLRSNTGYAKSPCAPDDHNTKTHKNILNNFNHLPR
jgi:hypothetical protein